MNLHQFGIAEESTYGTFVTPTRFFEFLPGESLGRRQTVLTSSGLIRGDRFSRGPRRVLTKNDAGGDINFEVADVNFGLLFEHMLGDVATVNPQGTVYEHTFTPGDISTKSLTLQKGVEQTNGTVQPFSYHGAKITEWEISVGVDEIANLSLTVDAEEENTGDALAATSYPALELFHFGQATLEIDDTPIAVVNDATIQGSNNLKTDRYFLGNTGLKLEPREMDLRTISGNMTAEFENLTNFYNAFAADTAVKLELIFVGSNIEGAFDREFTVTLNDVRFTGETPTIEGPDVGTQNIPFEAYKPASGDAIEILYRTTDSTP